METLPKLNQIHNMRIHADFLINKIELSESNRFCMKSFVYYDEWYNFCEPDSGYLESPFGVNPDKCGFSACSLGWAAINPNLDRSGFIKYEKKSKEMDDYWEDFSYYIFGIKGCDSFYCRFLNHIGELVCPYEYCFMSYFNKDEKHAGKRLLEVADFFQEIIDKNDGKVRESLEN
jgi:hypothetical protein